MNSSQDWITWSVDCAVIKFKLTGGNLEDSTMNDADFVKNLISTTLGIDDHYSLKVERFIKSKRVLLVHFSDVTFIPKLFKTFRYE
ncbi:hypothetical protein Avbf_02095 [Armadillidium vulgare]|nr:hypothetical protein Avbf_02095 [Armadillidium vulgare]